MGSESICILKENNNWQVFVDYINPILVGGFYDLDKYYTKIFAELHPDNAEEIYTKITYPKIDELETTALVESDNANGKTTCR